MTQGPARRGPMPQPLPVAVDLTVSTAETKQLWWFLDGAIMNVGTRHHLWASWGLCPRHSWIHAVMEIENRGGRPFSTSILLEDLLGRAVGSLRKTARLPWSVARSRLKAHRECFTCGYQSLERSDAELMGLDREKDRANAMRRTRELVAASVAVWQEHSCPYCLGGGGPVCRLHLLEKDGREPDRAALREELADIVAQLGRFNKSMVWNGPVATPADRASWVEGLGWMYGWSYPASIVARQTSPSVKGR